MDGLTLKLLRVKAQVKQIDLAPVMGVTNSYLSHLENRHTVPPQVADRYVAALATLTTKSTDPEAVA